MTDEQLMVKRFHEQFGVECLSKPGIPSDETCKLRVKLIEEEFIELKEAIAADDIVEIADALADIKYVTEGAALAFGIDLDPVFREVHRSNMSKVWEDGTVHRREDGKVMKPPTYSPADVAREIARQRGEPLA